MFHVHHNKYYHLPPEVPRGEYFHSIFCYEVYFRMYLPLALEVFYRLFIDSKCSMAVDKIKKHLLGLTQSKYSPWPSVDSEFGEN